MPLNLNHNSAALRVCVDKADEGRVSGRVYSQRLTGPVAFSDVDNLLLQLEEVLNRQNFPQAFQRTRSFVRRKAPEVPAAARAEDAMSAEEVAAARGGVTTFMIYVITRRSTTWQGRIDWLDGSPMEDFSSVLELIKLTDRRLLHERL